MEVSSWKLYSIFHSFISLSPPPPPNSMPSYVSFSTSVHFFYAFFHLNFSVPLSFSLRRWDLEGWNFSLIISISISIYINEIINNSIISSLLPLLWFFLLSLSSDFFLPMRMEEKVNSSPSLPISVDSPSFHFLLFFPSLSIHFSCFYQCYISPSF